MSLWPMQSSNPLCNGVGVGGGGHASSATVHTLREDKKERLRPWFISHFYPPPGESRSSCDTLFKPSYGGCGGILHF